MPHLLPKALLTLMKCRKMHHGEPRAVTLHQLHLYELGTENLHLLPMNYLKLKKLKKKFLVKKPEDVDVKGKQTVVNKFKQLKIDARRQEHKDTMIKVIKKDMVNKHSKKDSVKKDMVILKDNEGEIAYSSRSLWKPPLPKTCCTHFCARPIHEKYAPHCCKVCAMFDCGLYNEAHARHGGKYGGGPMSKQQFKSWLTSKNLWSSDIELRCCCRDALDACKRPQLLQWAFDCWVSITASSRRLLW